MKLTELDIAYRLMAIERIPTWSIWWVDNPPSISERIREAEEHLRRDLLPEEAKS